jgi:hypothetical protein
MYRSTRLSFFLACVILVSCKADPPPTAPRPLPALDAVDHLVRASLALRGLRPSIPDLEAVNQDPSALSGIVDTYLESEEFLLTIADMHAEQLRVRTEQNRLPTLGPLAGVDNRLVYETLAESPLELVKYVVANDLPYTNIVTADYTMGSPLGAEIFGYELPQSTDDWQPVTWSDGRPMAGILSDAALWIRHVSNGANYHRNRANFIADVLLCSSFLTRDIPIGGGIDLADDEAVATAVSTQTECVGCHQSLDPLGANFWGFRELININSVKVAYEDNCAGNQVYGCYPLATYNPTITEKWADKGLRAPGYYGTPTENMSDVGQAIAADARFRQCTARRFYSYLAQVDRESLPLDLVVEFTEGFEASNLNAKALAKSIVLSDSFSVAHEAIEDAEDHVAGLQVLRPRALSRAVHDLTGFEWRADVDDPDCADDYSCWGEVNLFETDGFGFRVLIGGADGYVVTHPSHTAAPVRALVLEAFAAEAASYTIDKAIIDGESKLLTRVGLDSSDEPTIRLQLVDLHKLFWAEFVETDSTEVDETYQLFVDVYAASNDLATTWKVVLSAFLQDTHFLYY